MSLKITRRSVGDVTILDCVGRVTLGEGVRDFRDTVRDVVSRGRKKIILNYSEVFYIDSSGLGELVSAFTTVKNQGGELVLLKLTKRLKDLIQMEKLYTVFEIFDDEAAAVRRLGEVSPLRCLCPICSARSSPALVDTSGWAPQTCGNCNARFSLVASSDRPAVELIEWVQLPTYPDEYVEAVSGAPFRIRLAGRLNLFTSAGLSRIWRSLPARIALFDLRAITEVTPEGEHALLGLIAEPRKGEECSGAAISLEGLAPECAGVFSPGRPVFANDAEALAALAEVIPKTPAWPARFQQMR